MRPARPIEWPHLSGRVALYSADEQHFIHGFFLQAEQGKITKTECVRQVLHLHDAKVELGVDLVRDVV